MKLIFISVGKKHDESVVDAINDFAHRISHYSPVEWKIIPAQDSIEKEGGAILKALSDRDHAVLLDEKGKHLTSKGLAEFIEKRLNDSVHQLVFIIGGAFGVSESVRERAHTTVALSALTFPHHIVRLILAEQVYRAFTILKGEKYHHE